MGQNMEGKCLFYYFYAFYIWIFVFIASARALSQLAGKVMLNSPDALR